MRGLRHNTGERHRHELLRNNWGDLMAYRMVARKKGYTVIDVATGAEVASHLSLGRAKSLVEKENKGHELRMRWLLPPRLDKTPLRKGK